MSLEKINKLLNEINILTFSKGNVCFDHLLKEIEDLKNDAAISLKKAEFLKEFYDYYGNKQVHIGFSYHDKITYVHVGNEFLLRSEEYVPL